MKIFWCILSFAMAGLALAQPAGDYQPFGDVEIGDYTPWGSPVERGSIIFSATTPGDQQPNINLIGPHGYWEHFEIDDDFEVVHTPGDLVPGIYSVAASDEGLQLIEVKVEVRANEAARVHLNSQPIAEFVFDPAAHPAYPAGAYSYGPYAPYGSTDFGSFTVRADVEDTLIVVTGPDGYSAEARGSFDASNLLPGIYSVAATREGYAVAEAKVEVVAAQTLELVLTLTALEDAVQGN